MMNIFYGALTSFLICFFTIPTIINISHLKNLTDSPDVFRKSHTGAIPTLGGVGIFIGLILSVTFWSLDSDFFEMKYFISSLMIIFFAGIKDDLYHFVHYKKLFVQLFVAALLVHFGGVRISSLYRLFGVQDIPLFISYPLSTLTIATLINAFNLIDGVNCLAASVATVICLFFGTWYSLVEYNALALLSFSLAGALIAFMHYNKTPAKIFMGDTGSLIIGLVIAVLTIKFIEYNKNNTGPYHITSVPAVAIAILIVPLFDLLRVFTIRIYQGKSPLSADRNHTHHRLIDLGFSHMKISALLSLTTLLFIAMSILICRFKGELVLLTVILAATCLSLFIEKLHKKKFQSNSKLTNLKPPSL